MILILISHFTFSQSEMEKSKIGFRQITGIVLDDFGKPLPGHTIVIKGTRIGTQTDWDGKFCLVIPEESVIYIEFQGTYTSILREIKVNQKTIHIQLGKQKRKSKKAWDNYDKSKLELNSFLYKAFNSAEYKRFENICG